MNVLPRQPISIVGGGLSGLALGILLRHRGVDVELFESHAYPHHRVCGEFISGLQPELVEKLGFTDLMADAHRHAETSWHDAEGQVFYRLKLHRPAFGISRHRLDARMADRFCELGGNLIHHRWRDYHRLEKVVYTTGRRSSVRKAPPKWIGLKVHVRHFRSDSELEMHLGHGGYVGASAVEKGITNLCGLFPLNVFRNQYSQKTFENGLAAIGLHQLRERLQSCERVEDSRCGTMYFRPGHQPQPRYQCAIGDAMMQIPPFTGHGMTMALESAWMSHRYLLEYIQGDLDWLSMNEKIRKTIHARHDLRLKVACALHPFMIQGRLAQYWKVFGFLLNPFPPRIAPLLWGGAC